MTEAEKKRKKRLEAIDRQNAAAGTTMKKTVSDDTVARKSSPRPAAKATGSGAKKTETETETERRARWLDEYGQQSRGSSVAGQGFTHYESAPVTSKFSGTSGKFGRPAVSGNSAAMTGTERMDRARAAALPESGADYAELARIYREESQKSPSKKAFEQKVYQLYEERGPEAAAEYIARASGETGIKKRPSTMMAWTRNERGEPMQIRVPISTPASPNTEPTTWDTRQADIATMYEAMEEISGLPTAAVLELERLQALWGEKSPDYSEALVFDTAVLRSVYGDDMKHIGHLVDSYSRYRNMKEEEQANAEFLQKMEAGEGANFGQNLKSIGQNFTGAIEGAMESVSDMVAGALGTTEYHAMDPNSDAFKGVREAQRVRQLTQNAIEGENPDIWRKALSYGYQGAMSAGDNIVRTLAGLAVGQPGISLALAGMGAYGTAYQDAASRGGDRLQATLFAATSAALEVVTEKIPLDRLLNFNAPGLKGKIVDTLITSPLIEIGEEEASYFGGMIADAIIMGQNSENQLKVQELMAEGMTRDEAQEQVFNEILSGAWDTAATSWVSSAIMTGGKNVLGMGGDTQPTPGSSKNGTAVTDETQAAQADTAVVPQEPPTQEQAKRRLDELAGESTSSAQSEAPVADGADIQQGESLSRMETVPQNLETTQAQRERWRQEAYGPKTEVKAGTVTFDGDRAKLTQRQRVNMSALDTVAKALNIPVHVFESQADEAGRYTAPNGWYDAQDGSIHIDLNAGKDGQGVMLFTAAHELTHVIRSHNAEVYQQLADFLTEEYGLKLDTLITQQQEKARRTGREISQEEAMEEVIADSMETMLADGQVVQRLQRLAARDQGLVQRIKTWFDWLVRKIKAAYQGFSPDSQEGRMVAEMGEKAEAMQKMFGDALEGMARNGGVKTAGRTEQRAIQTDEESGEESTEQDSEGRTISRAQTDYFSDSVVRDEKGRLKPVYHGSAAAFTQFSYDFAGKNGQNHGRAFYFTDDKQYAQGFTKNTNGEPGNVYEVYLDIQKPINGERVTLDKKTVEAFLQRLDELLMSKDTRLSNYGLLIDGRRINGEAGELASALLSSSWTDFNLVDTVLRGVAGNEESGAMGQMAEYVYQALRETTGYDGFVQKDGDSTLYLVFNPDQIKRVDNREPTNSRDIRYSVRDSYEDQVDQAVSGTFPRGNHVYMGQTPKILARVGFNGELPMLTSATHLKKATEPKQEGPHQHGLSIEALKMIPKAISDPVMIMDSMSKSGSIVVVTDMLDKDGAPVIVSIKADGKGMYNAVEVDTNFVTGYYGRDRFSSFIANNVNRNTFLYISKKKATALATKSNTQWLEKLQDYSFDTIIRQTSARVNTEAASGGKKFSMRDPGYSQKGKTTAQLESENRKLRESLEITRELLKLQSKVTGGKVIRQSSVTAVARDLMQKTGAKGSSKDLTDLLTPVYSYIAGGDGLTWEGVKEAAAPAVEWIQEHTPVALDPYAEEVLSEIKGRRVSLNPAQKQEVISQYGTMADFRRVLSGAVVISDTDATPIDSFFLEMAAAYPGVFQEDQSDSGLGLELADIVDRLRSMESADSREAAYYADEVEADLVRRIYEGYWEVAPLKTVADKYQAKLTDLTGRYRSKMDAIRVANQDARKKLRQQIAAQRKEISGKSTETRKLEKALTVAKSTISDLKERLSMQGKVTDGTARTAKHISDAAAKRKPLRRPTSHGCSPTGQGSPPWTVTGQPISISSRSGDSPSGRLT